MESNLRTLQRAMGIVQTDVGDGDRRKSRPAGAIKIGAPLASLV